MEPLHRHGMVLIVMQRSVSFMVVFKFTFRNDYIIFSLSEQIFRSFTNNQHDLHPNFRAKIFQISSFLQQPTAFLTKDDLVRNTGNVLQMASTRSSSVLYLCSSNCRSLFSFSITSFRSAHAFWSGNRVHLRTL